MHKNLHGLHILVTRPQKQAAPWCAHLQQLGAVTSEVPVLTLEAVSDAGQVQAIKNIVLDFDLYQKAIFVSQNAVDFGMAWLEDYWPQLPQGIAYFAVGETTARHLQAYGVTVSALNAARDGAMNSESLLQAPEMHQVDGERIVIFRGCGGRGQLADVLRRRGASVDYCELYQRLIPPAAVAQMHSVLGDSAVNLPHVIALHSGESLDNFMHVIRRANEMNKAPISADKITAIPVLVPGARVAQLAADAGFKQVIAAENATDHAMSAALLNAGEILFSD